MEFTGAFDPLCSFRPYTCISECISQLPKPLLRVSFKSSQHITACLHSSSAVFCVTSVLNWEPDSIIDQHFLHIPSCLWWTDCIPTLFYLFIFLNGKALLGYTECETQLHLGNPWVLYSWIDHNSRVRNSVHAVTTVLKLWNLRN